MSLTSIRLREAWNWGGLTAKELAIRTYAQIDKHETMDRAAALAYYAMMSLVPFLGLVLVAGIGSPGWVSGQLLTLSNEFLPPEAAAIIRDQLLKAQVASGVGLLSFSTAVLLWSASSMFVAVMDATNAAYEVRDSRGWWKRRLLALVLTVVVVALLLTALALIIAWPYFMDYAGMDAVAAALATVVRWVVVAVAVLAIFAVTYYFGPDVKQEWEWITPGSAVGALVLLVAGVVLRFYVEYGGSYSETYGALGGVILMLLWLYVAGLALLVGAEINCVIEHAAPHGRNPGQKVAP